MKLLFTILLLVSASALALERSTEDELRAAEGETGSINIQKSKGSVPPLPKAPVEEICPPTTDPNFVNAQTFRKPKLRSDEAVASAIAQSNWIFSNYYQVALRSTPCMRGAILLSVKVSPSGKVVELASRSENIGIALIAQDVESEFRRIRFAPAAGEEAFDWVLNFNAAP